MTNKEAINLIVRNKSVFQYDEEMKQALDLAIKALRRVDCIYVKDECYAACGECGYCEAEEEGTK